MCWCLMIVIPDHTITGLIQDCRVCPAKPFTANDQFPPTDCQEIDEWSPRSFQSALAPGQQERGGWWWWYGCDKVIILYFFFS